MTAFRQHGGGGGREGVMFRPINLDFKWSPLYIGQRIAMGNDMDTQFRLVRSPTCAGPPGRNYCVTRGVSLYTSTLRAYPAATM
jgi:hypothetical protein